MAKRNGRDGHRGEAEGWGEDKRALGDERDKALRCGGWPPVYAARDAWKAAHLALQRSACALHRHKHSLFLNGVYMKKDRGGLGFLRLPRPSADEVYDMAFRRAKKGVATLEKQGSSADGASNGEGESEIEAALFLCYVDGPRLGKGECAVVVSRCRRIQRLCRQQHRRSGSLGLARAEKFKKRELGTTNRPLVDNSATGFS